MDHVFFMLAYEGTPSPEGQQLLVHAEPGAVYDIAGVPMGTDRNSLSLTANRAR